jgi:transcriptional regulator GlxA family with amidase domain
MQDTALLTWLRTQAGRVRRLGSICTGALVLGAAGLLDGRAATTHWAYCDRLARQCPGARVDADALYLRAGNVYTSAGVTAGMDMALGMVEEDWGRTVALAVAQELVMFFRRPGGQSQFSRLLQAQQADDALGRLELWILEHLDERGLSVERLADRAGMSGRHFARRFAERFGTTPAAYVRRARVERARKRLEDGATRLKQVARQCGFTDELAMSRAFRESLGITPFEYSRRFVG